LKKKKNVPKLPTAKVFSTKLLQNYQTQKFFFRKIALKLRTASFFRNIIKNFTSSANTFSP